MAEPDISFVVSTIGLVIPFILTDPPASADAVPAPISNAVCATVTWISQHGRVRPLTLEVPVSAVYTYVTSAGDGRSPGIEVGRLHVSFATTTFWTSTFVVQVLPRF